MPMPSEKRRGAAASIREPTRPTAELLAAYVDGVGELEVEERRRVERYLAEPASRTEQDATRAVIDQLRSLESPEPQLDWTVMERAIHAEVGDDVPRRSWLYRWRFALPAFALAAAAIVFAVVARVNDNDVSPIAFAPKLQHEQPVFTQTAERVTVYLDGTDLEIALDSAEAADDELDELMFSEDVPAAEASLGFLEPTDLAWIDELDDDALARAEQALERPFHLRKGS